MPSAHIIGWFSTAFGKHPEKSYKDLTREAYLGVLSDAGMSDGLEIESAWFGNTGMYRVGQGGIGGQVCMTPLVREGLFPERAPLINVHNACATTSSCLRGAVVEVLAGERHLSLVIGVEKLVVPGESFADLAERFRHGIDQFNPGEWQAYYKAAGEKAGKPFVLSEERTMFMDTYAMQAAYYMKRFGMTQRQLALCAAKSHNFGADNPRAQYRFRMTPEQVLADREVSFPLTRSMCAPIGDGAAALLVCSNEFLRRSPPAVQERAVKVLACSMSGGKYRDLDEPGLTRSAAESAFKRTRTAPSDVDLAEVHDATSFSEIYQLEMLGFCDEGAGGHFVEDGETQLSGKLPLNTSGGLVSKGHPIGATGASMIGELVEQLRGESGRRQVQGAQLALAENGGGVIGFDEAVCVVTLLERA